MGFVELSLWLRCGPGGWSPPLEAPGQMWLLPFLHSSPAVAALARLDALRPRWVPYSRTDLNTVGDAHTTTTPCPEVASPTRVSGNNGYCCFSPSANLAPADNERGLHPDQRSSTIRRRGLLGGRTRANALCLGARAIPTGTKNGNGDLTRALVVLRCGLMRGPWPCLNCAL